MNCAGLSSKLRSFDKLLIDTKAGVFFLKETKMKRIGSIKTENSQNYQIFELVRKHSAGGGLAFGAFNSLIQPGWARGMMRLSGWVENKMCGWVWAARG